MISIDGGHLQCCYDSKLCVSLLYSPPKVLHFIMFLFSKDTKITGKHIPFASIFLLDAGAFRQTYNTRGRFRASQASHNN